MCQCYASFFAYIPAHIHIYKIYILKSLFPSAARMILGHVTRSLSSALRINSKLLTMAQRALNKLVPASPSPVMYLPVGRLLQLQGYSTQQILPRLRTFTYAVCSTWNFVSLALCSLGFLLSFTIQLNQTPSSPAPLHCSLSPPLIPHNAYHNLLPFFLLF